MEQWKPVPGYEGIYEVSNLGRVRSLGRIKSNGRRVSGGMKRINQHPQTGYMFVNLCKDGEKRTNLIHRIVALAFLPNPNNYPCINHKDENRANNNVDNLEWCTYKHNNDYGTRRAKVLEYWKPKMRRVAQWDMQGNLIKVFPSVNQAARDTGMTRAEIHRRLRGEVADKQFKYNYYESNKIYSQEQ